MMNVQTAADYRRLVIGRGGSAEPDELLKAFLGRPFSDKAFQGYLAEKPTAAKAPGKAEKPAAKPGKKPAKN
jgi:hypothetical protein